MIGAIPLVTHTHTHTHTRRRRHCVRTWIRGRENRPQAGQGEAPRHDKDGGPFGFGNRGFEQHVGQDGGEDEAGRVHHGKHAAARVPATGCKPTRTAMGEEGGETK